MSASTQDQCLTQLKPTIDRFSACEIIHYEAVTHALNESVASGFVDANDTNPFLEQQLGPNIGRYRCWAHAQSDVELKAWNQRMTNADFFQTLRCLDIDEDDSILTFRDTLNRPNIDPIFLGCLAGLRCLQLRVCPGQVEMAKQPEDEDEREKVSDIVLGLWSSKEERKAGKQAHEMQPRTRNSPAAPLEVFIQLGLIFSCEADAIPLTAKSECWIPSNYVLVINLEDYSPWILRQSFIKSPGKLESYVDFVDCWNLLPGSDFENISMGRLADSITALNPSVTTPIQVTMVQYKACKNFRPNHNQNSQPVVDCARRTAQGGIRRTNDFTPSEKRNPRDIIA